MLSTLDPRRSWQAAGAWFGAFVLGAAVFGAAYGQAPLYYSNQNQYFLHGLAEAGVGTLYEDWLANTADPTPVFSALVAGVARTLHPWAFHVLHALMLGVYAAALLGLFVRLVGPELAARRWPVFLAALIVIHSAGTRWLSYRVFGQDFPWYFQAGVAGQYVLGAMLQPSVAGVWLVLAVTLWAWERPLGAVACLALGSTCHSTYLLPAALLTAGMMAELLRERRIGRAAAVGGLALLLVAPVTAYVLIRFRPTSAEVFAEAQDILAHVRIPHHALPHVWLDPVAVLQIAWVTLSLALVWRTRLFLVLTVPFILSVVLTLVQVATASNTLALLFPWRISSVLVPIATAVILSRVVALRGLPLGGRPAWLLSAAVATVMAGVGLWICAGGFAFGSDDAELAMLAYVREHRVSGDVYLLPVNVPNLEAKVRGSSSSDFKPLAEKKSDVRVIPIDLQRFRLSTGTPIFVDFKSIPYKDVEVVTWRHRLDQAQRLHEKLRDGADDAVAEAHRLGITHIVEPASAQVRANELEKVYEDSSYRIYRLTIQRRQPRTSTE